jgi:hypothetical protein
MNFKIYWLIIEYWNFNEFEMKLCGGSPPYISHEPK